MLWLSPILSASGELDKPIKWQISNGKWQISNGKWQMANIKWQMANIKCQMAKGESPIPNL
jgi:hypothetical protein